MKAIIFDLDDTLIKWKDEFIWALKKVLTDLGYNLSIEKIKEIDTAINESENYFSILEPHQFLKFINDTCHMNLTIEFVNRLKEEQKNLYYEDKSLEEMLFSLSQKYKLYILTTWFTETQIGRLKNMHIDKYFTKVYGGDIIGIKPNMEAFKVFLKEYKPSECLFVGDSLKKDIIPAASLGMHVLWLSTDASDTYNTISSIYDLKDVLERRKIK